MQPVTAVILGAGVRGLYTYAAYAKNHPEELKIVGVAEPDIEMYTPAENGHLFREIADSDSGVTRTLIPVESGQFFRCSGIAST